MRISLLLIGFTFVFCCSSKAEDWPQFLGPAGNSTNLNAKTLTQWSQKNYVWSTEIPGSGWSSPVYANGKVWVTTAITSEPTPEQLAKKRAGVQFAEIKTLAGSVELKAIAIDLNSGKIIHDVSLAKVDSPELINPLNSYASPTPAISGDKVVCHFGNYGTWCLDANSGRQLWSIKFVVDHSVGPGSSPVIHRDKVILVCDGIDDQFVAAVDLESGQPIWKTQRPPMRS
ncbi:MAG: PQQ-binding-like beta-propeller repeat protein, partial [Planctomycetota bacterium]